MLKMTPFLAGVYLFTSALEWRFGTRWSGIVSRLAKWGPLWGAAFGCIPQCGFSVVGTALYVRRLISPGTLLAVYLATSDEAVPVLLSMPRMTTVVLDLVVVKFLIALAAGMVVDLCWRRARGGTDGDKPLTTPNCGCCAHELSHKPSAVQALLAHPLQHTLKIAAYLFVLGVALNAGIAWLGEGHFRALMLQDHFLQPCVAALVGLVPNCFASVLIAQLFAQGVLGTGAAVAGLSAGAGLGLLVLVRENGDWKDTLKIVGLLLGVSAAAGMAIQVF
jgi:hypothetical protein